ncbi:MAG: FAD-dependent oxidoreductase, partial [Duodenibacillus sp.]|nr:FAD-dependent oxidoreductase [Duodenibacillus sp.]
MTASIIDRARSLAALRQGQKFDICVIGGGATGLGIALDAASRGFKVALIDRQDFAAGTSSRSTKLIHGGVRYMRNPRDWPLVREALFERSLMLRNAPGLVRPMQFIVPCFKPFEREYYAAGVSVYTAMASDGLAVGYMKVLSAVSTMCSLPGIRRRGLKGGVQFLDAQFDDARMAVTLARTAAVSE